MGLFADSERKLMVYRKILREILAVLLDIKCNQEKIIQILQTKPVPTGKAVKLVLTLGTNIPK